MEEINNEIVEYTKICRVCNQDKAVSQYTNMRRGKYGVKTICIECNKQKNKEYYQTQKERLKLLRVEAKKTIQDR